MAGCLYIVATPIGNLEDLSRRAQNTLALADLILCEDTRRTRKLLSHLGLKKPLESLHQHNEPEKIPKALEWLAQGKNLAFASDAGTPTMSDPGARLTAACQQAGFKVIPIPGPSALTAALSVAGMNADQFLFLGFLPAKTAQRKKLLRSHQNFPHVIAIFEAPHRIRQTVDDLREVFGDRRICLCRELTKVFEQVRPMSLSQLQKELLTAELKGEITIIIQGAQSTDRPSVSDPELNILIEQMLKQGKPLKQIAQELSGRTALAKNLIYAKALKCRNQGPGAT